MMSGSGVVQVDIMRSLSHPAIVRVFDWYDDEQRIFIVMELCKGGELFDRIVEKVRRRRRARRSCGASQPCPWTTLFPCY